MNGHEFNVTLLVAANTIADAADGVNEALRELSPEFVVDWYIAPDGWTPVNIPENYEEGDFDESDWVDVHRVGSWICEVTAPDGTMLIHSEFSTRDEAEDWSYELLPYTAIGGVVVFKKQLEGGKVAA